MTRCKVNLDTLLRTSTNMGVPAIQYSSISESSRILDLLLELFGDGVSLPLAVKQKRKCVEISGSYDNPYFPIPFKETETGTALKAIEGSVAALLADLRFGEKQRRILISQEKTTAFLFQAYLARIGGLGKLDKNVKSLLKGE